MKKEDLKDYVGETLVSIIRGAYMAEDSLNANGDGNVVKIDIPYINFHVTVCDYGVIDFTVNTDK